MKENQETEKKSIKKITEKPDWKEGIEISDGIFRKNIKGKTRVTKYSIKKWEKNTINLIKTIKYII